jgi:hypothetical protein
MATKKSATHPADAFNPAAIAAAKEFTATLFRGTGTYDRASADTLAAIRSKARELEKQAGPNARRAIIHAVVDGKAIPIPPKFDPAAKNGNGVDPAASAAARKADAAKAPAAPAKAAKKAAGKKAPKKAAKAPAPKKAPKKEGPSKTETVIKMLRKGSTRAAIVEATGWQVDLKALAARKGLKLKKDADGVITATGGN